MPVTHLILYVVFYLIKHVTLWSCEFCSQFCSQMYNKVQIIPHIVLFSDMFFEGHFLIFKSRPLQPCKRIHSVVVLTIVGTSPLGLWINICPL